MLTRKGPEIQDFHCPIVTDPEQHATDLNTTMPQPVEALDYRAINLGQDANCILDLNGLFCDAPSPVLPLHTRFGHDLTPGPYKYYYVKILRRTPETSL